MRDTILMQVLMEGSRESGIVHIAPDVELDRKIASRINAQRLLLSGITIRIKIRHQIKLPLQAMINIGSNVN